MTIAGPNTLLFVASRTKSIAPEHTARVCAALKKIVDEDFYDARLERGNQSRAAETLRISQSTISDLYNGKAAKGVGLGVAVALADYLKVGVDELLGRTTPSPAPAKKSFHDQIAEAQMGLLDSVHVPAERDPEDSVPARKHAAFMLLRAEPKKRVSRAAVVRVVESSEWNNPRLANRSTDWWVREFYFVEQALVTAAPGTTSTDAQLWETVRWLEGEQKRKKTRTETRKLRLADDAQAAHDAVHHPKKRRKKGDSDA